VSIVQAVRGGRPKWGEWNRETWHSENRQRGISSQSRDLFYCSIILL